MDKFNTGPGSGPLKTNPGRHFKMIQPLTGDREGARARVPPKVSDKCVHVFGSAQTKANNQTVERLACQTGERTCCRKAWRDVRSMFRENRWGCWT